ELSSERRGSCSALAGSVQLEANVATGKVVEVIGAVIDIEFPAEEMPEIYNAVEIPMDGGTPLIAEVQQHLGNNWVRAVAMSSTDGLRRGTEAVDTGGPISVPVGPAALGRIFNVLGQPVDGLGPVESDTRYPIHRPAPSLVDQEVHPEVF